MHKDMKQFILLVILVNVSLVVTAQAKGDDLLGRWQNEQQTSILEFQKTGDSYWAKLVWMAEPTDSEGKLKSDRNNPDREKRNQVILGMIIVTGLHFDGKSWIGGEIYAPGRGTYARCSIDLKDGKLDLNVSKGPFSMTKVWSEVL